MTAAQKLKKIFFSFNSNTKYSYMEGVGTGIVLAAAVVYPLNAGLFILGFAVVLVSSVLTYRALGK